MIAHIREADKAEQRAAVHCENVSLLAGRNGVAAGLEHLAALIGLMHDMGKFTHAFETYIKDKTAKRGSVQHSPAGAIYAYERWYPDGDQYARITAQIISMVIRAHHGGLLDCAAPDESSQFLDCIAKPKGPLFYDEAVENFTALCKNQADLDELFNLACGEVRLKLKVAEKWKYEAGMISRFALSCVVDADRWDTACFEAGKNPFEAEEPACWKSLAPTLETKLGKFGRGSRIGALRGEISDRCLDAARMPPGVYTLTVPTGGGKTLSGLRFALNHAILFGMERIFFVIPYNTILEQNGKDIRDALDDYEGILEHYGTFVSEKEGPEAEWDEEEHLLLTERWDARLILTSMVQFLDSAYKGSNTSARRFCRLAKSVIIFDEIQALPKKCTTLFEKLVRFLVGCMGCTVLLCTATQPALKLDATPLLRDDFVRELNMALHRVELTDKSDTPKDYAEAASELAGRCTNGGSALAIVNTKAAAREIFALTAPLLPADCLKVHLSTAMCPAHRLKKLDEMRETLDDRRPVFCVSTMLIEAGVNISFPFVMRSLAGLPSVMQAAGRCNRHMELSPGLGNVEIWRLSQERLGNLKDIVLGQKCTEQISAMPDIAALDGPEAMGRYFDQERAALKRENTLRYPSKVYPSRYLSDMLDNNAALANICRNLRKNPEALCLHQAFATAGREFRVIDQDTVNVLVPYKYGNELIASISGERNLKERIRKLRLAQKYSVGVFRSSLMQMEKNYMLYSIGDTGLLALREEYYNDDLGLVFEPSAMELLEI